MRDLIFFICFLVVGFLIVFLSVCDYARSDSKTLSQETENEK